MPLVRGSAVEEVLSIETDNTEAKGTRAVISGGITLVTGGDPE